MGAAHREPGKAFRPGPAAVHLSAASAQRAQAFWRWPLAPQRKARLMPSSFIARKGPGGAMVDNPVQQPSEEYLKQAAAEAVRQGVDIRSKVHDLTLLALRQGRFDGKGMQDVIRAVTEGIATGAQDGSSGMRQVFADGLKGMDQALGKSAAAGAAALKQLAAAGKGFSDNELKTALASLRQLEHDFVSTVSRVADAAGTQVQPSLREALGAMTQIGRAHV